MSPLGAESASAYVWALVSGLPGEQRRRRPLLMLQAFIDDSKSDGRLFVLAGYIAPAEAWARLSDEWEAELKSSNPPLDEFKMAHKKWETDRCERFYRIIEKHVSAAVSIRINLAALARVVESLKWPPAVRNVEAITHPYWFAYHSIIDYLFMNHTALELSGRVDFVFDEQSEKTLIRNTWDYYKSTVPEGTRQFLGDEPTFKCSVEQKPLQAADFWAWWVRRWEVDGVSDGVDRLAFPWKAERDLMRLQIIAEENDLRGAYGALVDLAWTLHAAKNLHLNRECVSWPPWVWPPQK